MLFLAQTIDNINDCVPMQFVEIREVARTLSQRAADDLGYFGRPGISNGTSEATDGRFEYQRGIALGFRNLSHYIARSLLETGEFKPALHTGS